jgi:transcription termination/antitermination protein NusG
MVAAQQVQPDESFSILDSMIPAAPTFQWYTVQVYSNQEPRVAEQIMSRARNMGFSTLVKDAISPTRDEMKLVKGVMTKVQSKLLPGYILINALMDIEIEALVRGTPGVIGFIGADSKPTALDPAEVKVIIDQMESSVPVINIAYKVGDQVTIKEGPFVNFVGNVSLLEPSKNKVTVMVNFFGREVPVELNFLEVEKG